ncbi:MAG: flagellar FliJ family protein [Tepidisphaeraceae bacterium]|jgi:flagellar export protein FliJ
MPAARFRFSLQPALDHALSEQEHCQRNLAIALSNVASERAELNRYLNVLEQTRQQIRDEYDKMVIPLQQRLSVSGLTARSRYLESLGDREAADLAAIDRQRARLNAAEHVLADRREDLARQTAEVEALDKLKEKQNAEFQAELLKAEDTERDDQATLQFKRKKA